MNVHDFRNNHNFRVHLMNVHDFRNKNKTYTTPPFFYILPQSLQLLNSLVLTDLKATMIYKQIYRIFNVQANATIIAD